MGGVRRTRSSTKWALRTPENSVPGTGGKGKGKGKSVGGKHLPGMNHIGEPLNHREIYGGKRVTTKKVAGARKQVVGKKPRKFRAGSMCSFLLICLLITNSF
jgi:hypothetical protein